MWEANAPLGTILLFPGRTEILEKYGRVARELNEAGYTVLSIDWRGQGHSDRLIADHRPGHVGDFIDYQLDVSALVGFADNLALPKPHYLVAHSMGGCIGLRALMNGMSVDRVVFSAPMWGIYVAPLLRPLAASYSWIARKVGQSSSVMPGTRPANYVTYTSLADNMLTTDLDHHNYMIRQAEMAPEIAVGGPTVQWFHEAHVESAALAQAPRPAYSVLTFLGTRETIVEPRTVQDMHRNWPTAQLELVEGAKHELMMEAPHLRSQFMNGMLKFLDHGNQASIPF
ncbi:MAG: alpha/beta fold hydrolase [Boseongicola sp.]